MVYTEHTWPHIEYQMVWTGWPTLKQDSTVPTPTPQCHPQTTIWQHVLAITPLLCWYCAYQVTMDAEADHTQNRNLVLKMTFANALIFDELLLRSYSCPVVQHSSNITEDNKSLVLNYFPYLQMGMNPFKLEQLDQPLVPETIVVWLLELPVYAQLVQHLNTIIVEHSQPPQPTLVIKPLTHLAWEIRWDLSLLPDQVRQLPVPFHPQLIGCIGVCVREQPTQAWQRYIEWSVSLLVQSSDSLLPLLAHIEFEYAIRANPYLPSSSPQQRDIHLGPFWTSLWCPWHWDGSISPIIAQQSSCTCDDFSSSALAKPALLRLKGQASSPLSTLLPSCQCWSTNVNWLLHDK